VRSIMCVGHTGSSLLSIVYPKTAHFLAPAHTISHLSHRLVWWQSANHPKR